VRPSLKRFFDLQIKFRNLQPCKRLKQRYMRCERMDLAKLYPVFDSDALVKNTEGSMKTR